MSAKQPVNASGDEDMTSSGDLNSTPGPVVPGGSVGCGSAEFNKRRLAFEGTGVDGEDGGLFDESSRVRRYFM